MHHDYPDRYSRLTSPVHRLPAQIKLIGAVSSILAAVLMPANAPGGLGVIAVLLLLIAGISRVPPAFLVTRLLLLEPFAIGVALLALCGPDGGRIFLLLLARSTICLFTMILLTNTTPFERILALLGQLRAPALLITTLALMYRYLFVLVDEAERMHRARHSRTFRRDRRHLWQTGAQVIGQLFVRSTERAERIYTAMCARGWK